MGLLTFLRKARRHVKQSQKPLSFHVEALHIPEVQHALWHFLDRSQAKPSFYCITPINQLYVEAFFGPLSTDYEDALGTAYQHLIQLGYALHLHVHLTRVPNVLSPTVKTDMIRQAYEWMERVGARPKELVLGWFAEEHGVHEICEELGLRLWGMTEHLRAFKVLHDFNLVGAR